MTTFEAGLSIALGLALAAATGFRVFLPMLIASIAAHTGHLPLGEHFTWLGSLPAMIMLAVAATAEVAAYYIPVVDNVLDALATPAALVAGSLVAAAVMVDLPPLVKWSAAIIGGAGAASGGAASSGASASIRRAKASADPCEPSAVAILRAAAKSSGWSGASHRPRMQCSRAESSRSCSTKIRTSSARSARSSGARATARSIASINASPCSIQSTSAICGDVLRTGSCPVVPQSG